MANAAALAISAANQAATNAAVASNVAASVASVSGGTSSVTTGANQTSTGWTSDMPDYSGVDSTTSPDFSRPNDLGSSLGDTDQVNISSGKKKLTKKNKTRKYTILVMVFYKKHLSKSTNSKKKNILTIEIILLVCFCFQIFDW